MSTLWQPDVCGCEFIADSKTFAFESQTKICLEHKNLGLLGEDSFNQALVECALKSQTVVESQKAYPEIRIIGSDPTVLSEETLDPKKVAFEFDPARKFIFTVQLDAAKKADIQTIVDGKVGAGNVIIQ